MVTKTLQLTGHDLCREFGYDPANLPPNLSGGPFDSDKPIVVKCSEDFPENPTASQIFEAMNDRNVEFYLVSAGY